jgi:hypothetical protein
MKRSSKKRGAVATAPERSRPAVSELVLPYQDRLARDSRWALSEGSKFFEGKSAVQEALRKITTRLRELGIDYAVAGGMALFNHGFRRFTEDVDLLVTRDGLKEIHARLEGLGYLPPFSGSKHLRDMDVGVKIEFLVTGEYPGDGMPKPVSFPNPAEVGIENDGIKYLNLTTLVELKLASGMTNPERMKDLADVLELIKILGLPTNFAENLHPFVREKFQELWQAARPRMRRFIRIWRGNVLTPEALRAMFADGVTLDPDKGSADARYLVTTNPDLAKKYDMHDEAEFLDQEEDPGRSGADGATP